jgi:hypothetical protein
MLWSVWDFFCEVDMKLWLMLAVVFMLGGCGEDAGEDIPTHVVYGKLTSTTVNPSGKDGLIKLVGPTGSIQDNAIYSVSCGFSGPNCEYRIHWVLEANYNAFAFIDMNGNADYDYPLPDSGDLTAPGRALILWDNAEVNFGDDAWRPMP